MGFLVFDSHFAFLSFLFVRIKIARIRLLIRSRRTATPRKGIEQSDNDPNGNDGEKEFLHHGKGNWFLVISCQYSVVQRGKMFYETAFFNLKNQKTIASEVAQHCSAITLPLFHESYHYS